MDFGLQFWEGSEMASRTWELRNKYQHLICPCSRQIIFQWPPSPFLQREVSGIPCSTSMVVGVGIRSCPLFLPKKQGGGVEQVRGMNSQPPNRWIGSVPVRERWPHFRLKKFDLKLPFFVHQIFPKTNLQHRFFKKSCRLDELVQRHGAKLGPNSEWLG